MKKMWFFVVMIVLMAGCGNGSNEPKEIPPELTSLVGTKWKLVGFFDVEKNELIEPLVKDCEKCYTLEFGSDDVKVINEKEYHWGRCSMVSLGFGMYYDVDYQNSVLDIEDVTRPAAIDFYDGERFANGIYGYGDKFELKNNELKLYYYDDWDEEASWPNLGTGIKKTFYLLLKRIDLDEK